MSKKAPKARRCEETRKDRRIGPPVPDYVFFFTKNQDGGCRRVGFHQK